MKKLIKFYLKTYSAGDKHIPKNLLRFKEYTIIEKKYNEIPFCELSMTKEQNAYRDETELKDTLYNPINISWYNLEKTKENIVFTNISGVAYEVDIVDEDGNPIDPTRKED